MKRRKVFWIAAGLLAWFGRDGVRGQTISPTGCTTAQVGQPCTVSIQIQGQAAPLVTDIQFALSYPAVFGGPSVAIGTAIATTKNVPCSAPANATITCTVFGLNKTAMPNGEVAKATFSLPSGLASGMYLIQIGNIQAVNSAAAPPVNVAVTAGGSLTVTIAPPPPFGDLNADGRVDAADANLAVVMAWPGAASCSLSSPATTGPCSLLTFAIWRKQAFGL